MFNTTKKPRMEQQHSTAELNNESRDSSRFQLSKLVQT